MLKVLVVDDEAFVRNALRETLSLEGCEVRVASSGEEALEVAEALRPDILFLDVDMPGRFDGLEVCRQLTGKKHAPVVVMVTGHTTEEEREAGMAAGASDYLTKPFSPLGILERLERVRKARGP